MKDNVAPAKIGAVDVEAFSKNLARMVEEGGKALAAYLRPREEGQIQTGLSDGIQIEVVSGLTESDKLKGQPAGPRKSNG